MTTKHIALYVRVSTSEQDVATQVDLLEGWLRRNADEGGHGLLTVLYADEGVSGATVQREGFQRMLEACRAGQVSRVVAVRVDRLSRSLADFALFVEDLRGMGVGLTLTEQPFNSKDPMGEMLMGMMAVFAQFERRLISERTKEGMAFARSQGRHMGRKSVLHRNPKAAVYLLKLYDLLGERKYSRLVAMMAKSGYIVGYRTVKNYLAVHRGNEDHGRTDSPGGDAVTIRPGIDS